MGKAVFDASAAAREVYAAADAAFLSTGADADAPISRLCFEGPIEALTLTAVTQPAIVATSSALVAALREACPGLEPAFAAGHSLGEYSALVAAGGLAADDAVRLCRLRGQAMQDAVPAGQGAMAAIMGLDVQALESVCAEAAQDEVVSPANFNAPGQIVIAGHAGAVGRVAELVAGRGGKAIPLKVSAPFHCALMRPAAERLASVLATVTFSDPAFPVYTNVDASPVKEGGAARDALLRQVEHPVRWDEEVARMLDDGYDTFVEFGPGKVLSSLVKRMSRDATALSVGDAKAVDAAMAELSR